MARPCHRPTRLLTRTSYFTAAMLLLLSAASAGARQATRNAAREKRVEQQLEAIAPAAVPVFRAATVAMDRNNKNDAADAARLFQQVIDQAPRFAPAFRRRGYALVASGQREAGLRLFGQAVALERSPESLIALAEALLQPVDGQSPSKNVVELAFGLAQEAGSKARSDDDSDYLLVVAQTALSLHREKEFRQATAGLMAKFPEEMATHYFSAIVAAMDGEWILAERRIKDAQTRGLPPATAAAFLDAGVARQALIRRVMGYTVYVFIAWGCGLAFLFVAGKLLSRATLVSIGRADPNGSPSPRELFLRKTYRRLIGVAGSYYYLSIPFLIVSVVVGTGTVIYMFMLIGWLPLGLLFGLAAGALLTVIKSVQTLFTRVSVDPPGRYLELAEAPELWNVARQTATVVGTRPVDEIRVTPGTEMAVYEHGSRGERQADRARRVLILGLGLIDGFRQAPFCAVLAHEYGHFAHRDTAGGELALRVNNDMMRFAIVLVQNEQAVWWNFAWQFLRFYSLLFRRISRGATRLQEVLADRVAARHYGAVSFEEGLRHVVRRHLEFTFAVNEELREALESRRPLRNLYALETPRTPSLEHDIENALSRPTSEDDTHPAPDERFRLVRHVPHGNTAVGEGLVWDLFADRESVAAEMTARIELNVKPLREAATPTAAAY